MKKINIGLDLGIASAGWAVVNTEKFEIIDAGSRIFNEANNSNVSMTSSTRRGNRSKRRGFRCDHLRRDDLIKLFIKQDFIQNQEEFEKIKLTNQNVYELRKQALENKISINELISEAKENNQELDESQIMEDDPCFPCEIQLENRKINDFIKGPDNKKIGHEKYLGDLNAIFTKQKEV